MPTEEHDDLVKRLEAIEVKIDTINRAVVGDLAGYVGILTRLSTLEMNYHHLDNRLERNMQLTQENRENWHVAKNRAIGLAIGLTVGSAGVGATIATIITKVLGG